LSEPAEERLLEAVRAGRREACVALVEGHYAAVYRFLLSLTRNVAQAEDLTQETFAAAWQNLAGFDGRSSAATWLHRIAYRKFIDGRRSAVRRAALTGRLAESAPRYDCANPLEALVADDEARWLAETVQRLEEPDRVVIVLHYSQGLSYREMAEVLGEPAGTVKWRTSAALERLRALLVAEESRDDRQVSDRP
jgi:RNA polymerase sigma-70 factor, ECF subfamily